MPCTLSISPEDVNKFDLAIAVACTKKSPNRLEHGPWELADGGDLALPGYFRGSYGSLVISFDGGWYPFLDNTAGPFSLQKRIAPQTWDLVDLLSRFPLSHG